MKDDFEPHHTLRLYMQPCDTELVLHIGDVPLAEGKDYKRRGGEIHVASRFDMSQVAVRWVRVLTPQQKRNGAELVRL